jgi:cyclic beta-1,2-glucan synthetase
LGNLAGCLEECYTVFSRPDGTGFSTAGNLALTAGTWPEPGSRDGFLLFVRDLDLGAAWRLGAPSGSGPMFPLVKSRCEDGIFCLTHDENGIAAALDVFVLPGHRAELRRLVLTNHSERPRRLDVTSLVEIALNEPAAHAVHPGFSKLFVQTESLPDRGALLARRRSRSPHEHWPLLVHALGGDGPLQWETDRLRWRGRGRHRDEPQVLNAGADLSGTTGNVLDPVASLRRAVTLAPGADATFTFLLGAADDRESALALADIAGDQSAVAAAFAAVRAASVADRAQRGWTAAEDAAARALAVSILEGEPALRAHPDILARAGGAPGSLAAHGVAVDRALVVVHGDTVRLEAVSRLLAMHALWRDLGLPIQVVLLAADGEDGAAPAGALRLPASALDDATRDLLDAAAGLVLTDDLPVPAAAVEYAVGAAAPAMLPAAAPDDAIDEDLQFFNGHGGFSADGREYVIRLAPDAAGRLRLPPLPWTNVIANDRFGCIVSETAFGSAWCDNSRENRLTPWSNDPVLDPPAEALYLRDDATGARMSCLPGPVSGGGACEVRHGFGYTRYLRGAAGLTLETTVFVDRDRPVRLSRVRVTNTGAQSRRLSLWSYSQLVLGGLPTQSGRFVVTAIDQPNGALLARNLTAGEFADHVAFAAVVPDKRPTAVNLSGDRAAFLGPERDATNPSALASPTLDGRTGAGLEPCFALQASLELEPGGTAEVTFLLGQERGQAGARALIEELATRGACETAWQQARDFWRDGLGGLQVTTPSPALDLMLNGWLGYQTLSCRVRGRSAFYQSGGAFGYRDQLQDSLSLLPVWPELTRRQIVLHAGHQFVEGDVLHWWHPPLEAGIRTRFADDLLWLPYIACEYARQTGDQSVFDETAPYVTAPPLTEGEDEVFVRATDSGTSGTVFEHCCRALDRSLKLGAHGLPLFGTGDWNDGMNRVGREGRGESTWMGFFLVSIIDAFAPLCERRGETEAAARYRAHRDRLAVALNDTGWDGQWYRRGYYDDGAPLGSHENRECRIDALAQAWSVLSKVAPPERAAQVMDQVETQLVSDGERLVRLLTPPFVDTPRDPGYIRGYVAGVRENGGQYTHAATWVVRAMAELGRRDRAAALLDLLNPVLHAATPEQAARYLVEPYVVAADVYGAAPHVGRGGWTWYTGSSGWLQRVALESVLGLDLDDGQTLVVAPCVPDAWPGYRLEWRLPGDSTRYVIVVNNPDGCSAAVVAVTIDGQDLAPCNGQARLPLRRDGRRHLVEITLGPDGASR